MLDSSNSGAVFNSDFTGLFFISRAPLKTISVPHILVLQTMLLPFSQKRGYSDEQ